MENVRNRQHIELVSCPTRLRKLISRHVFKDCITYSENLTAVSLRSEKIDFCKPISIGFTVLELSKTMMYNFHYNIMKKHYGANLELMYTDTGNFFYY